MADQQGDRLGLIERSRLFVRDIEPDPGYETAAFEPGTWEEFVPVSELEGAVDRVRALRVTGPEHYDREEALRIESWNAAINAALAAVRGQ